MRRSLGLSQEQGNSNLARNRYQGCPDCVRGLLIEVTQVLERKWVTEMSASQNRAIRDTFLGRSGGGSYRGVAALTYRGVRSLERVALPDAVVLVFFSRDGPRDHHAPGDPFHFLPRRGLVGR